MMSSLEKLCHESNGLLQDVQSRMVQYDQVGNDFVLNVQADINETFKKLTANFDRMDVLVDKEPFSRRQNSKLRVDQIKYDFQHLQSAFRGLQSRREQRLLEERQREELLATDFSQKNGHTAINIDADLRHHSSLRNVNRNMDNLLDHGQQILTNLRDQRSMLKGIKSRVLDIGTRLGLSTTVMKMIERRGSEDKYFLYGGMVITLCLMFAMYWYLA